MNYINKIKVSSQEFIQALDSFDYNRRYDTPTLYNGKKQDWDSDYYDFVSFISSILEKNPELLFEKAKNNKNCLLVLLASGFLTDSKAKPYCSDFLNLAYQKNPTFDFLQHLQLNEVVFESYNNISKENILSVFQELPIDWLYFDNNCFLTSSLEYLSSKEKNNFSTNIWGFDKTKDSPLFLKLYRTIKNRDSRIQINVNDHVSTSFDFSWFSELYSEKWEKQFFMDGCSVKNHFFMLALEKSEDYADSYLEKISLEEQEVFNFFTKIQKESKNSRPSSNKYINGDFLFEEIEKNPHYLMYKSPDGLSAFEYLVFKFPTTFRSYLYSLDSKKKLSDVQQNILKISGEKSSYSGFSPADIALNFLKNNRVNTSAHYNLQSYSNLEAISVVDALSINKTSLFWQSSFFYSILNTFDISVEKNKFSNLSHDAQQTVLKSLYLLSFENYNFSKIGELLKELSPEIFKVVENLKCFQYKKTDLKKIVNVDFEKINVSLPFKNKLLFANNEFNLKLKKMLSENEEKNFYFSSSTLDFIKFLTRKPLGSFSLHSSVNKNFLLKSLDLLEKTPEVLSEKIRDTPIFIFLDSAFSQLYNSNEKERMYQILNKSSTNGIIDILIKDEEAFLNSFSFVFESCSPQKWFIKGDSPISSVFNTAKKIKKIDTKKDFISSAFSNKDLMFSPPYKFSTYDLIDDLIPEMIEKGFDINEKLEDGKSLKDYVLSSKNTNLIPLISSNVTSNNFDLFVSIRKFVDQNYKIDVTRNLIRRKIKDNSDNYLEKDLLGINMLSYLACVCPTALISEWQYAKKDPILANSFKEAVESKDVLGRGIGYYFKKGNHKERVYEQLYSKLPDFFNFEEIGFLKKELLGWKFDKENTVLFKYPSPPEFPTDDLKLFGFSEKDKQQLKDNMLDDLLGNTHKIIGMKLSLLNKYDSFFHSIILLHAINKLVIFAQSKSMMKKDYYEKKLEDDSQKVISFINNASSSFSVNTNKDKFLFNKINEHIEFASALSVKKTSFDEIFNNILPKLVSENKIKKSIETMPIIKKPINQRF